MTDARQITLRREFRSRDVDRTIALGRAVGRRLVQGIAILLFGDLGSGKTAFAQGLAAGLEVPSAFAVTSPTYTLINEYPGRLPFYHVDLYRLPNPVDPDEIGLLDLFAGNGVTAVEWSQRLHPADRPLPRLEVHFRVVGESDRSIGLFACGLDSADLLKDIGI
ncbi:MAG TPA: tRNA (adenosine(37)-N6)-threonylcarbamoyltransferase complex ATPase subunit type 1 TsaE [Desulfosarcina sp.]|nr:tRNA (adenosine(37)-N6)-threonylcarbamoyltransferase complex ATPase subunit type 1 TsaE [Desulfosarcina sp.]